MWHNVFYQAHINIIGGVETFLYELARLANCNNRDLTILYDSGDREQIKRLQRYCRTIQIDTVPKPIKCDRAFFNYSLKHIDEIEANEYIQLIHADFCSESLVNYPITKSTKLTKIYAVSKNNAISYERRTGILPEVLYNPINIDKEPRILTLIAAQRMTQEKGVQRLERLVKELDNEEIPYVLHIFSDEKLSTYSPNIMYHKPTLDIRKWIQYADYMICLSDTEGYSYSVYESLCLGTPLIITDLPVLPELEVNSDNAIVVNFDMTNLDVHEIYNKAGTFNFDYKQKDNRPWLNLIKGKPEKQYVAPTWVKIVALRDYTDTQENRGISKGEIYEVTQERAELIVDKGFARYY